MESWLRNVEMMDQWMDVRRQINTLSERRTELSNRMQRRANHLAAYPAKVSTHRCAPHPQRNCHNPMVSRTCRLHCSWTSNGSVQIRIWFICFLSPWQVNKAGANGNKEVLSDFTPEQKNWQHSGVHWTFLSTPPPQHDPLIITKSTFQFSKRRTRVSPNIIINQITFGSQNCVINHFGGKRIMVYVAFARQWKQLSPSATSVIPVSPQDQQGTRICVITVQTTKS